MDKEKDDVTATIALYTIPSKSGTDCLLCGEFIEDEYPSRYPVPKICPACKELWKKLKEEV